MPESQAPPPPLITVALVDDAAPVRQMMRALLEQDGRFVVVGEADNGHDALELMASKRPDAVVLDLAMPGVDGLDTIPKIRESAPNTKVLVVSAAGLSLKAEALEAGAHGYFSKLEPLDHAVMALGRLFHPR